MTSMALEGAGQAWRLALVGDWSLRGLPHIEAALRTLPVLRGTVICDWSRATTPGIGSAWVLLMRLSAPGGTSLEVRHEGDPPHWLRLLDTLHAARDAAHAQQPAQPTAQGGLARLGHWAVQQGRLVEGLLAFFGRIVMVLGAACRRLSALRFSSLVRHIYETGITAIPIVSLIAFLIAVIVAYLGSQQLSRFGADIFVVDLVTIAVLREMGVLLTAIIIAGRSGSAFAAEIGVMQLNEETDALRAMGMNPVEILVVPRVLALVIALPLLTIIADAMGLAGGGLLSILTLHIPVQQFITRMHDALAPTTFWSGLVKAPVFALIIAVVGTYRGLQVRNSSRELGRLTTEAVVQSIFLVILADAAFAILFVQLDF